MNDAAQDREPETVEAELVAELVADPANWDRNSGKWDEIDTRIQAYIKSGLSFRAIADRPDIPLSLSTVYERFQRRQLLQSIELLCALTAHQYEEHDRLVMEARAASALQKRRLIDPETGDEVMIDADPRLAQMGIALQVKIFKEQRELLGMLENINRIREDKAKHEGLDEVEAARAEVLELLPRFLNDETETTDDKPGE